MSAVDMLTISHIKPAIAKQTNAHKLIKQQQPLLIATNLATSFNNLNNMASLRTKIVPKLNSVGLQNRSTSISSGNNSQQSSSLSPRSSSSSSSSNSLSSFSLTPSSRRINHHHHTSSPVTSMNILSCMGDDSNDNSMMNGSVSSGSSDYGGPITMDKPKRKRQRLDHLSKEEKIMRRKLKNRMAAQSARDRKKVKMGDLEMEVIRLGKDNESLLKRNQMLEKRLKVLENENAQLRKFGVGKIEMDDTDELVGQSNIKFETRSPLDLSNSSISSDSLVDDDNFLNLLSDGLNNDEIIFDVNLGLNQLAAITSFNESALASNSTALLSSMSSASSPSLVDTIESAELISVPQQKVQVSTLTSAALSTPTSAMSLSRTSTQSSTKQETQQQEPPQSASSKILAANQTDVSLHHPQTSLHQQEFELFDQQQQPTVTTLQRQSKQMPHIVKDRFETAGKADSKTNQTKVNHPTADAARIQTRKIASLIGIDTDTEYQEPVPEAQQFVTVNNDHDYIMTNVDINNNNHHYSDDEQYCTGDDEDNLGNNDGKVMMMMDRPEHVGDNDYDNVPLLDSSIPFGLLSPLSATNSSPPSSNVSEHDCGYESMSSPESNLELIAAATSGCDQYFTSTSPVPLSHLFRSGRDSPPLPLEIEDDYLMETNYDPMQSFAIEDSYFGELFSDMI